MHKQHVSFEQFDNGIPVISGTILPQYCSLGGPAPDCGIGDWPSAVSANVQDNRDREDNATIKTDADEVSGSSDCSFSFGEERQ